MLAYGTYDDNVHPQNEQAFADALIRAGILFDTAIYPMRKHGGDDRPIHLFRRCWSSGRARCRSMAKRVIRAAARGIPLSRRVTRRDRYARATIESDN
jgi:hypothetical protein